MRLLDDISHASRAASPRIVLSEGEDPRIIEAALKATRDRVAQVLLIGDEGRIRELLSGCEGAAGIEIHDPRTSDKLEAYSQAYFELRKHKGLSLDEARRAMQSGLDFAAMMLRQETPTAPSEGPSRPPPRRCAPLYRSSARRPGRTSCRVAS